MKLKTFDERSQLYEKLLEDSDQEDYGAISKTKFAKKYYTVPYTDEEKKEEYQRQKKIVTRSLALCLAMMAGGLLLISF